MNQPAASGPDDLGATDTFVSKNRKICKGLTIRNAGMQVKVSTRKTGIRILFGMLLVSIIGLIGFLGSQGVFDSMDAFGKWMFGIMLLGPLVGIGVFYAFPGQCLVADKGARTIEIQHRWLTMPIRRKIIRADECAALSVAVLGVEVTERTGLKMGSTLLGTAALAAFGVGWIHYKTATRNIPVYGILIKSQKQGTILTHITWNGEDCDQAVLTIRKLLPQLPESGTA